MSNLGRAGGNRGWRWRHRAAIAVAAAGLLAGDSGLTVGAAPARTARSSAAQAADPTQLTIGEQTGPPGAAVVVPINLAAADTIKPGVIEVRVTFPKATLTFAKLEPSGLSLGVSAKIETKVVNGPDAKSSTLVATIATPADATPRNAFSAGLIAYLGFTIDKDAKPGTVVMLQTETVLRTADAEPKAIAAVTAVNGKVTVSSPPVISCFFYMH